MVDYGYSLYRTSKVKCQTAGQTESHMKELVNEYPSMCFKLGVLKLFSVKDQVVIILGFSKSLS